MPSHIKQDHKGGPEKVAHFIKEIDAKTDVKENQLRHTVGHPRLCCGTHTHKSNKQVIIF